MKLTISYLTVASAISIAAATSCTHEVASPWPYTDEEPCATVACAQEQAYANCIAVSTISPGRTCVRPPSMLKRDVDLDCATGETCTVFTDNSPLCLTQYNGNFHDDEGGSGNAFSIPAVYTFSNGDVTTVTPTATANAKADEGTPTVLASVSTKGTSASQSESTVAAGTQSPGSSSSSHANAAPSQYTGGAVSRSSVHAALLALAALPVVAAAI